MSATENEIWIWGDVECTRWWPKKVELVLRAMGGESQEAWRDLPDDPIAHGLHALTLLIDDGGKGRTVDYLSALSTGGPIVEKLQLATGVQRPVRASRVLSSPYHSHPATGPTGCSAIVPLSPVNSPCVNA